MTSKVVFCYGEVLWFFSLEDSELPNHNLDLCSNGQLLSLFLWYIATLVEIVIYFILHTLQLEISNFFMIYATLVKILIHFIIHCNFSWNTIIHFIINCKFSWNSYLLYSTYIATLVEISNYLMVYSDFSWNSCLLYSTIYIHCNFMWNVFA